MRSKFIALDGQLESLPEFKRGEDHSGSTAVCVMLTDSEVICANLGAFRAARRAGGAPLHR